MAAGRILQCPPRLCSLAQSQARQEHGNITVSLSRKIHLEPVAGTGAAEAGAGRSCEYGPRLAGVIEFENVHAYASYVAFGIPAWLMRKVHHDDVIAGSREWCRPDA